MNILIALTPIIFLTGCNNSINIVWAPQLDQVTTQDSWLTWHDYYSFQSKKFVSYDAFKNAIAKAKCEELSPDSFLMLNIENHRLNQYWVNLQVAQDAYPPNDRPRGEKDILSVEYFLKTANSVSPITVAKFIDKSGKLRLIKLDGVHRIVAAFILDSPIRLCWIDLTSING
jgi:hypothetical protein